MNVLGMIEEKGFIVDIRERTAQGIWKCPDETGHERRESRGERRQKEREERRQADLERSCQERSQEPGGQRGQKWLVSTAIRSWGPAQSPGLGRLRVGGGVRSTGRNHKH